MIELPPPPRLSGAILRSLNKTLAAEPVRRGLTALMRKDLGIEALQSLPESMRGPQPLDARPVAARREKPARDDAELGAPTPPIPLDSAATYAARYEAGETTPVVVAERAFAEARRLHHATPSMRVLSVADEEAALRDAAASAARWAKKAPLSPLDGVPIPIKEELDLEGLGYRCGTAYIPQTRADKDATSVARLRAAGALILGHTCMTEMGMSPLGANAQRQMPRNAHDSDRMAGGSSTGSGVAVATGLAPVAMGSDGGGSIRIPASFNGVFGLKPTFGRISRTGDGFGGTMAHLGPIGASARDLAIFLEAASGEDPEDVLTHGTPQLQAGELLKALGRGVKGLRIGVLESEIEDADSEVQNACLGALEILEEEGAILVPQSLRLAPHAGAIGAMTICMETFAALRDARMNHWDEIGPDLQLLLRVFGGMGSGDYLDAQRLRYTMRQQTAALLREVDVLAMPTTRSVAPPINAAELRSAIADTPATAAACRYAFLTNLTGNPAGTAPVGRGERGLPVGLQIIGDAFDEHTVLQVLAHLERSGAATVRAPRLQASPLR